MTTTAAQDPAVVSEGVEARWYVRGALDPTYATPEARDRMVQDLARTGAPHISAAFLTGWVTHRPQPATPPVLTWHRLLGDTAVVVTR